MGAVDTPPPPKEDKEEEEDAKDKKANEEEEESEVEQVVDMNTNIRWKSPVKFRVRWVGYGEKDDSWIALSDLNCQELIDDFLEISGRKPEFEKILAAKKQEQEALENFRSSSRRKYNVYYSELDEDEDEVMVSGTRSRQIKTKAEKKIVAPPMKKKKASHQKPPPPKEYEVSKIVD